MDALEVYERVDGTEVLVMRYWRDGTVEEGDRGDDAAFHLRNIVERADQDGFDYTSEDAFISVMFALSNRFENGYARVEHVQKEKL